MANPARLFKRFRAAGTNGRLDLSLFWRASEDPLIDYTRYDQGPEIHGMPKRVSLLVGKAQLDGCLRVWVNGPLDVTQAFSDYTQGFVQDTVYEASVSAATPDTRLVRSTQLLSRLGIRRLYKVFCHRNLILRL